MAFVELSEVHRDNPLQILLGFLFNCVFLKELECLAAPGQKKKKKIVSSHGSGTHRFLHRASSLPNKRLWGMMRPLVKPTWCLPAFACRLFVWQIFTTNAFAHSQVASFTVLPSRGREFPKVVRDGPLYFLTATFQAPQRGDLMLLGIP